MPLIISGTISPMVSKLAISGPVPSTFWRTLMRTFSHLSPSIRSSPPRPSSMSLPLPPRMMLPPSKKVTPAPRNSCSPAIRPILVSTLPFAPAVGRVVASASSPRSTSAISEPDSPSTKSKRVSTEAPEPGICGWSKKRLLMSMVTPWGSPLKIAQSNPDAPM
ncbi:hypothetical protein D3C84_652910 [compost metagenome]